MKKKIFIGEGVLLVDFFGFAVYGLLFRKKTSKTTLLSIPIGIQ